jgi:hypothetical protein
MANDEWFSLGFLFLCSGFMGFISVPVLSFPPVFCFVFAGQVL